MDEWKGLDTRNKLAWVLGFKKGIEERHWNSVKKFIRVAWQIRTDRMKEGENEMPEEVEHNVPEDWAGYSKMQ